MKNIENKISQIKESVNQKNSIKEILAAQSELDKLQSEKANQENEEMREAVIQKILKDKDVNLLKRFLLHEIRNS